MRHRYALLLAFVPSILLSACGGSDGGYNASTDSSSSGAQGGSTGSGTAGSGGTDSGSAGTGGGGVNVLETGPGAFDPDFENSSEFVTRMNERAPGLTVSPHGMIQMYYSANMESVLGAKSFDRLPEGTVAIKIQDRDGDETVDQIMVMVKQADGTDSEVGDWVWEQYDPDTRELVTSSADDDDFRTFCSGCHADFPETDWLAGTGLSN